MFATIRGSKPYHVNLDIQNFWAPTTAAHSAHGKQKTEEPVPVPTPALTLQEESSSDVEINLNRLPVVSGHHLDKLRTAPSNATHINAGQNEDTKDICQNVQEAHSSQSVDMLLLVDAVTTSLVDTPPEETKSFERALASPSMVFDSNGTGELDWTNLPTIHQAAEEAAITPTRLAKHLSKLPLTPPASGRSQAEKAPQIITESIIPSVNCLPTSNTPAQVDSIPEIPSARSSIQQFPVNSAKQEIDASDDGPYWVGSESCQPIMEPLQRTEDLYIPSSPNQSGYGHSFAHDNMRGVDSEKNGDDSIDGNGSSYAHNDAQGYETSSSEKEAADYDSDQPVRKRRRIGQSRVTYTPSCANNDMSYYETSGSNEDAADYDSGQLPRKRVKVRESLATDASSRGRTSRSPASTELLKQMGKIIPSSSMLSLASSLAQDSSNNGDIGAADAIIYEEVTFLGRLRFSSVNGIKTFHMQWEFPQDTDGGQEGSSSRTIDAEDGQERSIAHPLDREGRQESSLAHAIDAEEIQESSISHALDREGHQENRITQRIVHTTPTRPISEVRIQTRIPFSRKEEDFLLSLKEGKKKLSWKDIHKKFSKEFPGRSCASLQVRYSTKLRKRKEV